MGTCSFELPTPRTPSAVLYQAEPRPDDKGVRCARKGGVVIIKFAFEDHIGGLSRRNGRAKGPLIRCVVAGSI